MQRIKHGSAVAIMLLAALFASGQNTGTPPGQAGVTAAQPNVLRILAPRPGEKLRQDFVTVHLQLTSSGASASGMPNYQLRLDGRDPVTTNSSEYTFTGLAPGPHTVQVQLVDANGTPIPGASGTVSFVVAQPAPSSRLQMDVQPHAIAAALRVQSTGAGEESRQQRLPSAAGALPLLSVIGFGALLGGIASAMKTR
jgi:hypothetical protein